MERLTGPDHSVGRELPMNADRQSDSKTIHGHTGPATPAEDRSREADPAVVSPAEKARIAEEASRAEDA
jgi:hypothetical protein